MGALTKAKRKLLGDSTHETESPKKRARVDAKESKKIVSDARNIKSVKSSRSTKADKSSKKGKVAKAEVSASSNTASHAPKTAAQPGSREAILSDTTQFTEKPDSREKIAEATLYDCLGSEDVAERLEAAGTIVSKLLDGDGVSEHLLDKHLEKRLFRGLASGRKAARLGFSVVLTEILQQLWGPKNLCGTRYRGLTFDFVLNTLTERTKPSKDASGQEEKDHYFGQLFGIECFVRARVLFDGSSKWATILALLRKLASKKSWLKSHCAWVIVQAATQMDRLVAEATLHELCDAGWVKSPEGVAIWIALLERFPSVKLPAKTPWQNPLATKTLQELSKALRDAGKQESSDSKPSETQQASHFSSQLHFVWDIILSRFIRASADQSTEAAKDFKQFWERVVDQGFFSKNATEPQKFTGFMVFTKFLEGGASYSFVLEGLFTPHLMTCLINQANKQDRYLHRAALKSLASIQKTAEEKPDCVPSLLEGLIAQRGAYNFDQRTKSKTIERLLQVVPEDQVAKVLALLQHFAVQGDEDEMHKQALVHVEYLSKFSSNAVAADNALGALMVYANPEPESAAVHKVALDRLQSALARLIRSGSHLRPLYNMAIGMRASAAFKDVPQIENELDNARTRLQNSMQAEERSEGKLQSSFAPLYAVAILQVHFSEPDALETLQELNACHDGTVMNGDYEQVVLALTEIALSLMAKNSPLMRQTSEVAFERLSSSMTPAALKVLTDALSAKEDAEGMQALFNAEDDLQEVTSDDESDEDEDDSDLGSDVEIVENGANGVDGSDSDTSEDASTGSDDENGDESEDQNQVIQIDDKLANILNTHRLDKDKEAESSSDESDMSDSEMLAMDDKLAEVFQNRAKNSKKDQKDAKQTVVLFKHRVLDLLAIYAKSQALGQRVFDIACPLLQLLRETRNKDLIKKAVNILQIISDAIKKAKKSESSLPQVDVHKLLDHLMSVFAEHDTGQNQAYAKSASTAALSIVRRILLQDVEAMQKVHEAYSVMTFRWQKGMKGFHWAFLADWMNYVQSNRLTGDSISL